MRGNVFVYHCYKTHKQSGEITEKILNKKKKGLLS